MREPEDLSQSLVERLPPQGYRHIVITVPNKMGLRKRFLQDPSLHRQMGRLIHRTLSAWLANQTPCPGNGDEKGRALPGIIMATQSFGDELNTHPHFHLLVSNGVFTQVGDFHSLGTWDQASLQERIRQAVTRSLVARQLLQPQSAETLLSWPLEKSGFSLFIGPSMALPGESEDVQRVLRYILRSSFPLNRIAYDERTAQVEYRSVKGRFKKWSHAVDFLADFSQHIPKPHQHQVCYAGAFANTLQMLSVPKNGPEAVATPTPTPQSRRTKWAALILRTWQVDPELCPKCRQKMTRGKTIFERAELNKILKALRIGDYPKRHRSPPPPEDEESAREPDSEDTHSQVPPDWDDWAAA